MPGPAGACITKYVLIFKDGTTQPLNFEPMTPKLDEGSQPSQTFKKITIGVPRIAWAGKDVPCSACYVQGRSFCRSLLK